MNNDYWDYDNNAAQWAQVESLDGIKNTLKEGQEIGALQTKIRETEIQIAALTDQGIDPKNLKEVLKKYQNLLHQYEEAKRIREEKQKKTTWIVCGVMIVVMLIMVLVVAAAV